MLVELDPDDTRAIVHEMHAAYNTTVVDALLTALAAAAGRGGDRRPVLVDLESTGRESDGEIADCVGWFTALYPVSLPTEPGETGVRRLVRVKEALRRVPGDGRAFGAAKYLSANEDLRRALAALPRPAVAFNYLGHVAAELRRDGLLAPLPGSFGRLRHVGALGHQLEVNALIVDDRLVLEFAWAPALDLRSTVADLVDAFVDELRSLAAQCRAASGPGATPSDFPLVTLDEAALAALLDEVARGEEAGS
jgi:non-ribosomal peptide synthase protein (TIGR01720 family)